MPSGPDTPPDRPGIPRTVWALGLVSLFMDISSEMIHALLPLFLTMTLGASVAMVGMIDGLAEATAAISKVFSGYVSDRIGRRKPLILLGYGLGAVSKPLFAVAAGAIPILGARFIDRVGKGLRGAPRDALVADVTPEAIRGRAYGLRQSLDTIGAFVGPIVAMGLMVLYANDFRSVFWWAIVPGAIAVLLVLFGVEDADRQDAGKAARLPLRLADLKALPAGFWAVTAIGVVFTMARFSEAFLVLKANADGLPLALAPLVLVVMNIVYSAGAYPAGALADKIGAQRLLLLGLACLIGADLILGLGTGLVACFAGIALWGAHMALSQGLLAQMVAAQAPTEMRGSAFGLFNLASGVTLLVASVLAGALWYRMGSAATFLTGAGFALIAGLGVIRIPPRLLSAFIATFGLVCCAIATAHIVLGPASIPGSVPVNATMDSEDRFYATLFLGFGIALMWCSRNLIARQRELGFLLAIFFVGGLARLVSIAVVGAPNGLFQFLTMVELVLPGLIWVWLRAVNPPA
ncbi:MAG: MFS transporter [Sphingomonadales bacterium]|nr:MFS transporter [Sphingomonadales bacterium]